MIGQPENKDVVDPAHAGMILKLEGRESILEGGPRACGDDPHMREYESRLREWTPRMRG